MPTSLPMRKKIRYTGTARMNKRSPNKSIMKKRPI